MSHINPVLQCSEAIKLAGFREIWEGDVAKSSIKMIERHPHSNFVCALVDAHDKLSTEEIDRINKIISELDI